PPAASTARATSASSADPNCATSTQPLSGRKSPEPWLSDIGTAPLGVVGAHLSQAELRQRSGHHCGVSHYNQLKFIQAQLLACHALHVVCGNGPHTSAVCIVVIVREAVDDLPCQRAGNGPGGLEANGEDTFKIVERQ